MVEKDEARWRRARENTEEAADEREPGKILAANTGNLQKPHLGF